MNSAPKPKVSTVNPLVKTTSTAKRSFLFAIIAIIIALLAAGLAAFSLHRISGPTGGIDEQIQGLSSRINQTKVLSQANMNVIQQNLHQQQKQLLQVETQLSQVLKRTANVQRQRVLSQTAYLLHLANLHLTLSHDALSASNLLTLAQKRLANLTDPALFKVKHAIANDIDKLNAVPKVNITDVVIQLDRLNQHIQALKLVDPHKLKKLDALKAEKAKADEPWYDRVLQSLESVKDLIIIRHIREPIMPLVSPKQQAFVKANIQTKLLQAEWAVLHRNNTIYQNSLKLVQNWINQYWQNKQMTAPINTRITNLLKINVAPPLPTLSDSLQAIGTIITRQASPETAITPATKKVTPKKPAPNPKKTSENATGVDV